MSLVTATTKSSAKPYSIHVFAAGVVGTVALSYTLKRVWTYLREKARVSNSITVPHTSKSSSWLGVPYFGEYNEMMRMGVRKFFDARQKQLGDIFAFYSLGRWNVVICSEAGLRWFETQDRRGYIRHGKSTLFGRTGIVNEIGKKHKMSRILFMKCVGPMKLDQLFPMIQHFSNQFWDECVATKTFTKFVTPSKLFAWKIGGHLTFNNAVSSETSMTILNLLTEMLENASTGWMPFQIPFVMSTPKRCQIARRKVVEVFERMIRRRLSQIFNSDCHTEGQICFLDRLCEEHIDNYGRDTATPKQMEYMTDQMVSFAMGVHQTVANTLTNAMAMLHQDAIQHPNNSYKDRFRQIYDAVDGNLTFKYIESQKDLSSFLIECMRICSLLTVSSRIAQYDLTTPEGCVIPRGTRIFPGIGAVHFENGGTEFDPTRHLRGAQIDVRRRFVGFGVGAHRCVGPKFAELELAVALVLLCGRCDWEIIGTPRASRGGNMYHSFQCSFNLRR